SAKAGIEVVLKDLSLEIAEKGRDYSKVVMEKLIKKGRSTQEELDSILSRITATTDAADLAGCDLVIEAVIEDRQIKAVVTEEAEAVIDEKSIFASNTSTLPITGLAGASSRPQNFIGLHFFSPVDKMPLVEIIMGEKTSQEALAHCLDYCQAIGKTPIVVNDGRGFYTSRVFTTYINEGINCLSEGIPPALIENAGKASGMPVGPLAVADEVSIDLMYHILKQTAEDLGKENVDEITYSTTDLFVNKLGRLGRKSGKGFYEYPESGEKYLSPELSQYFPIGDIPPTLEELKKRFLSIQSLESLRCLEEGILNSPRDGDIGSILGWGYPAYTGGALSYIDYRGPANFLEDCQHFQKKYGERFNPNKLLKNLAKSSESLYQKD
ncbi:MAG: 3-hydroxyacyl-CoA dehydrogenase, partial [Halobacteriovoraceae bacterium]|nr:3-hydroxyacyl-CoA dehydrogenase [Halobacteriovoraceae bacterium]